ncbi:MAG TPA: prepilin-type N-terminal cleavage/methylation domain-containing protein [Candidatus Saccharimonadales bacterium]|nr:prepilin-type N-terminal cleavage/methylation domain-containing protein [Candidatus Saccharimonadales bacterium]
MPKLNQRAFTLIELLIVIVILAILAALLAVSYTQIQKSARDKQRTADLQSVAAMLERFYSDTSQYPASNTGQISYYTGGTDCNTNAGGGTLKTAVWGTDGVDCNGKNYTKQLPKNIAAGASTLEFCYETTTVAPYQSYNLYAVLEGSGNLTTKVDCGASSGQKYNYKITSND